MKKLLGLLAVLIVFLVLAAAALVTVPPVGYAKRSAIEAVRNATGLDLRINGRIALRLWPALSLEIEDVALANPTRPPERPLIAARSLQVSTSLWPLVRGDRRIERAVLSDPRIDLEIDREGRPAWAAPVTTRVTAAVPPVPFSLAVLEATGASVVYSDQRGNITARLDRADITVRDVFTDRFAEAVVKAAGAAFSEPSGTTVEVVDLGATLSDWKGVALREMSADGATVRWRASPRGGMLEAQKLVAKIEKPGLDGLGPISLAGARLAWRDPSGGGDLDAGETTLTARGFRGGRFEGVTGSSKTVGYGSAGSQSPAAARATAAPAPGATAVVMSEVSFAAPVVALATPVEAELGFVWSRERVTGKVRLPSPEALASPTAVAAYLSLAASPAAVEFEGTVGGSGARGRTRVTTPSVQALGRWLDVSLPAGAAGPGSAAGDVDVQAGRITLSNGRIEHAGNALSGSLAVDTTGARPRVSGKLAADKLDADRYLGTTPVRRSAPGSAPVRQAVVPQVAVKDALKSYMRAVLEAPVRRGDPANAFDVPVEQLVPGRAGAAKPAAAKPADGFEWSTERIDVSALRGLDLDLDWSVRALSLRGLVVQVPQLKTVLNDGTLTMDGKDLATEGGKLGGRAEIDARQQVPRLVASLRADGVDLEKLSQAFGVTPMLDGATSVEANVTGAGASQRQLVESLSGTVKTRMGQGHVVGYDFSSVSSWLFGSREYDASRRTPFSSLGANLVIDKGVVKESQVRLDGPVIGADAEGSIKLVEQEIDYRARFRFSSWLSGIALRIFGDWSQPSVAPDLGSVFSRSRAPGGPDLSEVLAGADLRDAELAALIGRVISQAPQRGLDAQAVATLEALRAKAQVGR